MSELRYVCHQEACHSLTMRSMTRTCDKSILKMKLHMRLNVLEIRSAELMTSGFGLDHYLQRES